MWRNKPALVGFYESKRPMCLLWSGTAGLSSTITNFKFKYTTSREVSAASNLIPNSEIICWGDQQLQVQIVEPNTNISHALSA